MLRTFLAVEIGSAAREALCREQTRLGRLLPSMRWSDPAGLHLTLAFLGDLDDDRLVQAHEAALAAARTSHPFRLALGTLGAFGSASAPRVLWTSVTGQMDALIHLQHTLASELAQRDFPPEERPYAPHLTLARLRDHLPPADLATLRASLGVHVGKGEAWEVEALLVMKSELARPAPHYTLLASYPLGG